MKTLLVLVSVVIISILFPVMVIAASSMSLPDNVKMVQPDPSLPKELASFWGKWRGQSDGFLIVESIDEQKASLYTYRNALGWNRYEATVTKERGKYKLWFRGRIGRNEFELKGEYLDMYVPPNIQIRMTRVP